MNKRLLWVLLVTLILAVTVPALAGDDPFWTNFNSDPVKNGPKYYVSIPIKESAEAILLTRIRTYHWNSGNGAEPGVISVYEGDSMLGSWQAVGRSAYGVPNVYWEVLTDLVLQPGHSYRVKVSDPSSWSYNEASKDCGMFELYGEWPVPADYVPSSQPTVSTEPSVSVVVNPSPSVTTVSTPASGATYKLGRWEQDNNSTNGTEVIEWQVLTVQNGRMLLISKNILDAKNYIDMSSGTSWETGELRRWLNADFYNNAFTQAEKNQILAVTNENPDNTMFGTRGGNKTTDRIFLLSITEAERYFTNDAARRALPTAYASSKGAPSYTGFDSTSMWYLRSPGAMDNVSALIGDDGAINYGGALCDSGCSAVWFGMRPALWLALPTGFRVTYDGNNCLTKVPTDNNLYQQGDKVTVLFDPVEYISGLIFYGWDMDGDGGADFGYYYNEFFMPNRDVVLKAICYQPIYDYDPPNETPGRQQPYYPDDPGYSQTPNNPGYSVLYPGVG